MWHYANLHWHSWHFFETPNHLRQCFNYEIMLKYYWNAIIDQCQLRNTRYGRSILDDMPNARRWHAQLLFSTKDIWSIDTWMSTDLAEPAKGPPVLSFQRVPPTTTPVNIDFCSAFDRVLQFQAAKALDFQVSIDQLSQAEKWGCVCHLLAFGTSSRMDWPFRVFHSFLRHQKKV
jgi:hypothetical protein